MPWWGWVIAGVALWFVGVLLVVSLVRAGATEDKKFGR